MLMHKPTEQAYNLQFVHHDGAISNYNKLVHKVKQFHPYNRHTKILYDQDEAWQVILYTPGLPEERAEFN